MTIARKRGASPWLASGLSVALMCGAPTASHAASPSDARLQAMQAQLDELRAQLNEIRSTEAVQDPRLTAIQARLEAMAAQLAELKTGQDAADSDIATLKAPPSGATVVASLPNGKPALATADGRFTANLHAIVMFDAGKSFQDNNLPASVTSRDLNNGTNFRRARFGIDGRLYNDFGYGLIYEFGGSGGEDAGHIQEAWLQYTALKPWRIRVGAFEPNIGLAAAVSTGQMPILERPAAAEIARNVAAGDSRSALQLTGNGVFGDGDSGLAARWFLSTAITGNTVGTINSTGGSTPQPSGEQTGWIGRVAIAPFDSTNWQAHFGLNAQYVSQPNDAGAGANPRYPLQLRDRPELRIDATRLVDTGGIDTRNASVLGMEAGVSGGPFLLEGEYFRYRINRRVTTPVALPDPRFSGWYLQGVWVLTGETRPYNPGEARFDAPKPNYTFNPSAGTWGAVELAARYSVVDLNSRAGAPGTTLAPGAVRGGEQKISTLGVNWYLNPTIRLMLDYQHVTIHRLNAAGAQMGQTYDALAGRVQYAF